MTQGQTDFEAWVSAIRHEVDELLHRFFTLKLEEARGLSEHAEELVCEVRDLTMRGGKRLRPIVATAAFRATTGKQTVKQALEVGCALELLQTYLLIHDDWMDGDNERRGGPAVHYAFQQRHRDDHLGASLGILAGDLASTFAWELFLGARFPEGRRDDALRLFVQIQKRVFAGQQLDLMADTDVERMHRLKTGSYTTEGPAVLGGLVGDADADQLEALRQWAGPLGIAFQLRDDLLSTFGRTSTIGKPSDDLRHGKQNAVVAAFRRLDPDEHDQSREECVRAVWGRAEATEGELSRARTALERSGAKALVEERLATLADRSVEAIRGGPFSHEGASMLCEVTRRLTDRGH